MQEFVPPTPQHLIVFAVLVVIGTVVVLYFECHESAVCSVSHVLSDLVSVLLVSTGWSIIFVEGKNMFVEAWIEKRRKERFEKGRQSVVEQLRAKIRSTGKPLTEQDLEEVEQETHHTLPTNSR